MTIDSVSRPGRAVPPPTAGRAADTPDAADTPGAADRAPSAPPRGALVVLLVGIFVVTLDFFIVNVAIPSIGDSLHAGSAAIQFVVAGFALPYAAMMITGGRLGDLYGRRRMFATGLGLFTLASLVCGVAPDTGVLIGGRVLQGLAAALLSPQVLATINVAYTGERRARAFSAVGLAMGLGGVFGQLIGGLLIQADIAGSGWRAIFLINVPVGVAALALVGRLVPESRADGRARLDLVGTVLVALSLVAVVLPLVLGRQQGWPLWTWICLAAADPALLAFLAHQRWLGRRDGAPLVDLALFRRRAFGVGLAIGCVLAFELPSFFLTLALYLQSGRRLSALDSGLVFLPMGLSYLVACRRSGALAARLGRQVLALGAGGVALGYLVLAETVSRVGVGGSVLWLMPGLLIAGAGMGLALAPLPAVVMAGVAPQHASAAAGVLNAGQQAGGAIGVALVGLVFYRTLGSAPAPLDFGPAFGHGELLLAGFALVVGGLAQLLPRPPAGR
jgi:EmrB/QacA subfamily drug resistance transporter